MENDYERVINDIKKKLFELEYEDKKLDNIRQNLSYDIIKYLNSVLEKQINKVEPRKTTSNSTSIKHFKDMPLKTMRYKRIREKNK